MNDLLEFLKEFPTCNHIDKVFIGYLKTEDPHVFIMKYLCYDCCDIISISTKNLIGKDII